MYRSRGFNNYLNKNIKNKLFSEGDFLSRPTKRKLENLLTFIKGQHYEEAGIIPRSAISLTGPAGKAHAKNYKSINIDHVYIPEYSIPTYQNLVKSIQNSEYEKYITIRNVEFFDYFEELTRSGVMISDIDFDATCTLDSVSNELNKFAYTLSSRLNSGLTPVFTFTLTLSRRRTGGQTMQDLDKTFLKTVNSIPQITVLDMYRESYCDYSAMMTAMYVLGRTSYTSVVFPGNINATNYKRILSINLK